MANGSLPSLSNDIIGKGFEYPFKINPATGTTNTRSGVSNITASIIHILDTHIDEYFGGREFGSSLYDLVFANNDPQNDPLLQHFIIDSITKWEPRVSIIGVYIDRASGKEHGTMIVGIDFLVLQTSEQENMVYPFYLEEGAS